jgi:Protein of unknown function (DUF1573)
MKPWILLIVAAVAITAGVTVAIPFLSSGESTATIPDFPAPPKPDGPAPTLEIEGELTHLFGNLPQQYQGKHAWVFKNTGAGPLEVRGSSSSCSCTTSDLFEEQNTKAGKTITIAPGESKSIAVSFNTKANDGRYRQQVVAATNDPLHPEVILVVEGSVHPALSTIPAESSMSFQTANSEEPSLRRFAFYSADRPDLKLVRLATTNPALLSAEARPMTAEECTKSKIEKGYAIEVTLKPTSALGEFNEEIVIETDHPMKPEMRVAVKGKISGPISALPERVSVRNASSKSGGSEELTLWARGRTSVNFIVDKKPPGFDVTIEPLPQIAGLKGSKYKMTVKLNPGLESGRRTDEIVLKTDDPKVSELRLPVDVLVQGSR